MSWKHGTFLSVTCIVGVVDTDGSIYMGGDSAGTANTGEQSAFNNHKVFLPKLGPHFVMGAAGSFRLSQLLRYTFEPPLPPGPFVDLEGFMVTTFVKALRKCFKDAGFERQMDTAPEFPGGFLVGYQGRLFRIEDDYQVMIEQREYIAVGAGESVAMGAMFAAKGHPAERIRTALSAASAFNAWCREPYKIVTLPFSPNWHEDIRRKAKKRLGKAG